MKAVILAGGFGTRLMEETEFRPKPMVEIGGKPILWHIMQCYAAHGISDFVVCLGYKGDMIRSWFRDYQLHGADVTFDLGTGGSTLHRVAPEPWRVTLVETGADSMTGGRLARARPYLGQETFCCTYGDAVSTVDIGASIAFHQAHGRLATVTAVLPPARFGALELDGDRVGVVQEKPPGGSGWINGGFFVLEPAALDLVTSDATVWEREPMERLASAGDLMAFRHAGFWQPMDTLRDKRQLEALWRSGQAPWIAPAPR